MLDWELQRQLVPYMKEHVPLPGIYDADFIAANQDTRADNIIKGTRSEQVQQVRQQIRTFKEEQKLDKVQTPLLHLLTVCILAWSWYSVVSAKPGIRHTLQSRLSCIALCNCAVHRLQTKQCSCLAYMWNAMFLVYLSFLLSGTRFHGPTYYQGCLCSQAAFV